MTSMPDTPGQEPPNEAAERLASFGFCVVPIAPGKKYPEGLREWQRAATNDIPTIRNWYSGLYKGHGVGITAGPGSRIWVIDIDVNEGKQGQASLEQLVRTNAPLPPTVTAITGTGGAHLYFAWDDERPIRNFQQGPATTHFPLGPGIDLRGEGGFVVAPPTIHPDTGKPYAWHDGRDPWSIDVAAAPDWLYDLIGAQPEPSTPIALPDNSPSSVGLDDSIAEWMRDQYDWSTLLHSDGWTVHSQHGPDTWWTRPGKDRRQGHSAVLHGDGGPLVVFTTEISPALAQAGQVTSDGSGISLSIFGYVAGTRYGGDRSEAARQGRLQRQQIEGTTRPTPAAPATTSGLLSPTAVVAEPPPPVRLLFVADILKLEPPPPLVGDWLDLGMLATMPGKYGSLKSFAAMSMCLSVATGEPWLGQRVHERGTAIYCSLEGSYTLKPRVAGWLEHGEREDADGFGVFAQRLNLLDPESVAAFLPLIEELKPRLLVIDTLSKATPGAEENSKPDVSKAYMALDEFRRVSGGTVLTVHHTGHNASGRGRGFSGFEDDLDVVLALEGQWKDGPVRLVSQKQKARENPQPIWLSLATTPGGHPVVVPTVEPVDDGDTVSEAKARVMAAIARHPGELTRTDLERPESRGHVDLPRGAVRQAVSLLLGEERVCFERQKRAGDRQSRDVLVLGERR